MANPTPVTDPSTYTDSSIRVLRGLEPVRERPGMYTRTDSPTHIIQEVIDNAADEALGGFAKRISVVLHTDGSVAIEDDGRGIPVGIHPEEGVSTLEVVFTRLHAGGKFNKKDGGAYAFSGGLHGVGVSVTNALSSRMEVTVRRDGHEHVLVFAHGDVIEPITVKGEVGPRTHGTTVRAWPDPKYFDSPRVKRAEIERLLRSKAVLLPGLKVTLEDKETGTETVWQYENGMLDYLTAMLPEADGESFISPVFHGDRYISAADNSESFSEGEGAAWALAWCEAGGTGESYVNLIPTPQGGTHEAGLRSGLFEAVRDFAGHHGLNPKGVSLQPEDVWRYVRYVLSARVLDPQFQGQTKEKLTSRESLRLVAGRIKDPLDAWLNARLEDAKRIAELAIKSAVARTRATKVVEKKKQSGLAVLPGKLTDCEVHDDRSELFLVEGDSAGGSGKMARDRETQAILPLRGKILNTWEIDRGDIFGNAEVHDISVALGIDPHDLDAPATVLDGLRYAKLVLMTDADVDGSHIQTLLLTLFFQHFPLLVTTGRVFVAQPPLYCIKIAAIGKRPERRIYALDENERDQHLLRLQNEKVRADGIHVSRFKGLGEMNPDQLKETTMNPDTRKLVQISLSAADTAESRIMFEMLMAKGSASGRKAWMEVKGNSVEADV